jgi:hypothetical protein
VHGSMCDHTASDPLVAELREDMTTFAMDRRGFGASGDAAGHAIEREFEDVAAGDAETALLLVLAGIVGMTDQEVASLRAGPRWPTMLASAPTVPRECRAEDSWTYRPGGFDRLSAPTLLLAGSESPPVLEEATGRALAAIPGARVQVLDGHAHLAHRNDPAMVAAVIRGFVSGSAAASGARPGAGTRPG